MEQPLAVKQKTEIKEIPDYLIFIKKNRVQILPFLRKRR